MKNKAIFFSLAIAAVMSSCGGMGENKNNNSENSDSTAIDQTAQKCTYNYEENSAKVKWTAFKTTDKIAVGGEFDKVEVASEKADDLAGALSSVAFKIFTSSTNTKDTIRDGKVVNSFFGAMLNTEVISGEIVSVNGDETKGNCTINLTMNEVAKQITMDYTSDGILVNLTGSIDLNDFNGGDAITALNEVCKDLHKGKDGVSKTWTTVDINISANITKDCK